jgi:hypothetical protein
MNGLIDKRWAAIVAYVAFSSATVILQASLVSRSAPDSIEAGLRAGLWSRVIAPRSACVRLHRRKERFTRRPENSARRAR